MSEAASDCDLLIGGGFVLGGGDQPELTADGAVAIRGNRIVAIGAAAGLDRRWRAARRIDARGKIAMPGLVNTHNHTPLMVTRGMVEDIGFAPAYTANVPQGHALSFEDALVLARLGVYELLRFGSTTIVDNYNHAEALARASAELGMRAFIGGRIHDADTEALTRGEWRHDHSIGERTLQENEALIQDWHGREGGRIQCIVAPHAADTCSRDLMAQVAKLAEQSGLTVHTHLAQSAGEVERVRQLYGREPSQLFDELGLLGPKLVAGHCIHVPDGEIERIGRAGVRVAHSPFGNAVSGRIAPVKALEAAGATITLCTDTKSGDMFEAMRTAVSVARIRGAGYAHGAAAVLRWATANGAAALGLDDELGELRPGALADIVLLDADAPNLRPLIAGAGQVVYSAMGMNVDTVIVDGRVLIEGGRAVGFDGPAILREAQSTATRLWQRYRH